MRHQLKLALKLSTLSLALLAAGCGGGGGETTSTGSSGMTVQGTAAKGIIKKGLVEVYSIDAQGAKSAKPVATTTTADDGTYTVQIPKDVLNFVVEVSAATGATMADEATGADIPVPAGMKLRNVVTLSQAPDGAYTGHVSPLTEMVVKAAESAGGLVAANITKAKAGVTVLLGFDPEKVKPVNSNSADAASATEAEKLQSLTLAALSKLAKDGGMGCTDTSASDRVACVVNKVAASATLSGDSLQLTDSLRSQVQTALTAVAADTTINSTGKTSVAGAATFSQSTVPATNGAATGLQAAKEVIASLRNTANALSNDGKTGALDLRAQSLVNDFDKAIAPLDDNLVNWVTVIPTGIDHFVRFKSGVISNATVTTFDNGYPSGGCTVYSDANATQPATSPANAVNVACSASVEPLVNGYSQGSDGYTTKFANTAILMTPTATPNTFAYTTRTRLYTTTYSSATGSTSTTTTVGEYGGTGASNRGTGTITYAMSGDFLSAVAVAGMMPARIDTAGNAITDHELWNLNFTRTDEGSSLYKYALAGSFTSVKNGANVAKVTIEDGSMIRVQEDGNGSVVNNGLKAVNFAISAEAGTSKASGTLTLADGATDKNGLRYQPTKGTFAGKISTNGAEFFSGSLSYEVQNYATFDTAKPVSASNFTKEVVGVSGKITVPNRPALNVNISATTNNAFDTADLIGQYNDGTAVINASVTNGSNGRAVSISSASGVTVNFEAGQQSASVKKDGTTLGTVNLNTGVINFVDGSFESLQ